MRTRSTSLLMLIAAAALALAGCAASPALAPAAQTAADGVTIGDSWVKAADSGMSAAFGELKNSGSEDVTIVSATSAASSTLQLHETVQNSSGQMVMQEKAGGFVIPAGGSFTLAPGGNHIMLMDVVKPIKAGDSVSFTLTFADGSTMDFTAPAKDYSGANETYQGDMKMGTQG